MECIALFLFRGTFHLIALRNSQLPTLNPSNTGGCFSHAISDAVITTTQHSDKTPSEGYDKDPELVHRW